MPLSLILLLSTLTLVNSTPNMFVSISGDINYDGSNPNIDVRLSGEDREIIIDKDRYKFHINDNELKDCVKIYKGKRPTDAYVRSPTPWGDLYSRYGWRQVYRIVKPLRATVHSISTKPDTISYEIYKNSKLTPGKKTLSISRTYENKLSTTWSKGEEFTVDAEVRVSADLEVLNVGSTTISVTNSWGQEGEYSQATSITDTAQLGIFVPAMSSRVVRYEMSKTLVNVKVEYEASLEGATAVNYKKPYEGHHFYGLNINYVMSTCGLRTEMIIITEDITLDLISGAKIEVVPFAPSLKSVSANVEVIEI